MKRILAMESLLRFPSAVKHDPSIDAWLRAQHEDLRPFVEAWFARMRRCGSDVRELMHDGCPTACVEDAGFGYVAAYRDHVNVGFFRGTSFPDPARLLEGTGRNGRHVKLRPDREVDAPALETLVVAAYADMRARVAGSGEGRAARARRFAGSIPSAYERLLVPFLFALYAEDVARRVARRRPERVLEIACGTGVVTRRLAELLPASARVVATDLNAPMLDEARKTGTSRPVEWRVADATSLPFGDASFDVVVCQFGAMFFPDRPKAYSEARRVLRPGGAFVFSVWDRIEENEIADAVTSALAPFLGDRKSFLVRLPHGYHSPEAIARELALGGFVATPRIELRADRSRSATARDAARAYCEGTPLRSEIEEARPGGLPEALEIATREVERRFGPGPIDAKIQALVVEVEA